MGMNRSPRLAELVVHLTGCTPAVAIEAVASSTVEPPQSADEALAIVARALYSIHTLDLTEPVDLRDPAAVPVR